MKKIFLTFLIFLSLSYAKDLDILSIASNGSLSDKTSHKLNDDELKEVVGGFVLYSSDINYLVGRVGYRDRLGKNIWYKEYYYVVPDKYDSPSDLVFYNWLTILDPINEYPVIEATYNFQTGQIDTRFIVVNTLTQGHRDGFKIDPLAQEIYNKLSPIAKQWIYNNRYRIDLLYGQNRVVK